MPGLLFCVFYLLLSSHWSRFFSSLKDFFLLASFTGFGFIFSKIGISLKKIKKQ